MAAPRRAWIFDQLGPGPHTESRSTAIAVEASNLGNLYSPQIAASVDLNYLELGVLGSQRLVPTGSLASDVQQVVDEERYSLGVQLGRTLNFQNKFGRFGLGYYMFFPRSERKWAGVHIDTGLLPTADSAWRAHLRVAVFLPLYPDSQLIQASMKVLYGFVNTPHSDFAAGARMLFSAFFQPKGEGTKREYLLLALGPAVQWQTGWGTLGLEVAWRLWLDKSFEPSRSVTVGSANGVPDFRLNWTVGF